MCALWNFSSQQSRQETLHYVRYTMMESDAMKSQYCKYYFTSIIRLRKRKNNSFFGLKVQALYEGIYKWLGDGKIESCKPEKWRELAILAKGQDLDYDKHLFIFRTLLPTGIFSPEHISIWIYAVQGKWKNCCVYVDY